MPISFIGQRSRALRRPNGGDPWFDVLDLWFSIARLVRRESQSPSSTAGMVSDQPRSANTESGRTRDARTRLVVVYTEQDAATSVKAALLADYIRGQRGPKAIRIRGRIRLDRQGTALRQGLLCEWYRWQKLAGVADRKGEPFTPYCLRKSADDVSRSSFPGLADAVIGWANKSGKSKMSREVYASTEPVLVTYLPTYRYPDCLQISSNRL